MIDQEKTLQKYADSFLTGEPGFDRNVLLKRDHTLRVAAYAAAICRRHFKADAQLSFLAKSTAMFHDWSRFEQLRRFNTFNDAVSFDHGRRSRELIDELGLASGLPADQAGDIGFAVEFHNRLTPPPPPNRRAGILLNIVRDADKLDIMEILAGYAADPVNPTIALGLDRSPEVSPEIRRTLLSGAAPAHRQLKTSADFLASRLRWADELNFPCTCEEFIKRDFFRRLTLGLTPPEFIAGLCEKAEKQLRSRCEI